MFDPPVFIGGINRSGTSLMRQLLGSHCDLAIPPTELRLFDSFPETSRRFSPYELESAVDFILKGHRASLWELRVDEAMRFVSDEDPSLRGLFVGLLRAYAAKVGKRRFGEKTTQYERHLGTLDRWFPDGYAFVQVIRHPVLAYASISRVPEPIDPTHWSMVWLRSLAIGLDRQARARDSFLAVRYEDLVRDPVAQLRPICSMAGLDYDAGMLEMGDYDGYDNSGFDLAGAQYEGRIRVRDDADRVATVPEQRLKVVRRLCGDAARVVGYDVDDETTVTPVEWPDGAPSVVRRAVRVHAVGALVHRVGRRLQPRR